MSISFRKKVQKLNQYLKISDREVYFRAFNSIVLKERYNYTEIERDLQILVRKYFNNCAEIYYLGSRVIGLGYDNEQSDLDLFIDTGNQYFLDRFFDMDCEQIEKLKDIFFENAGEWTYKKINYSVPSIKAVHRKSGILCDISVTNGLAVHNSELLGHLFDIQPEAVAFFHYLKKWLLLFDVRFKGFSLTLIVIFFLQKQNLMPKIEDVQKDVYPVVIIDEYAVQFDSSRNRDYYRIKEMKYYKDHVKDFFDFYADFKYGQKIICTYSGEAIEKEYFDEKIDCDHPMTISAPLLRRTNCAKYLTNSQLVEFVEACRFSSEYLKEYKPPKDSSDYEFFDSNRYLGSYRDYDY